jgi:hypothetical protein
MNDKSLEKNKKSEFLNLDKDDEYVEYEEEDDNKFSDNNIENVEENVYDDEEEVEENENQNNLKREYNFDKEKEFYE